MFFTARETPIYSASVIIEIEEPKMGSQLLRDTDTEEALTMQTIGEFIMALESTGEAADRMTAIRDRELNTIKRLLEEDEVERERIEDSNLIEITAEAPSPEEAVELANRTAELYVKLTFENRLKSVHSSRQWIEARLDALNTRLDKSEEALKRFNNAEGAVIRDKRDVEKKLIDMKFGLSAALQRYSDDSPVIKKLKVDMEDARVQLKRLITKELEHGRLSRVAEYDRRLYDDMKEKAIKIRIAEETLRPEVNIVESAAEPEYPVWPNKFVNGLAGAAAGLIVGVSAALFSESLQTSLRTIEEVETFTGLPVLGAIPYLIIEEERGRFRRLGTRHRRKQDDFSRLKEQLVIHYNSRSPIVESYRSLRTNIQSTALEKGTKVFLVTSTGPGEGKSITTSNLAITLAQAGRKVLLVDSDLRRPILHNLFGLKREPGLSNCLTGTAKWQNSLQTATDILAKSTEWEEVLKTPVSDNLKIMTCGRSVNNPVKLLDSKEIRPLINELKANFDIILFDSPPVLPISDAIILCSILDGVIFIYQAGIVPRTAFNRARQQLENAGAKVEGIVLNNTTREMENHPSYSYYRYQQA